ncbi:MAG: hypothetical protein ABJ275_06145 [Maricaulaceae bacterium]
MLFILFVLESLAFAVVMAVWDFQIIDEMSDPTLIKAHIEAMSEGQRAVHAVMTGTLDVAYPLTYGALFAGVALKVFRPTFTVPSLLVVPVDLTEGVVQVMALNGDMSGLWLKSYVTPLKLILFVGAIVIAILALIKLWKARLRR